MIRSRHHWYLIWIPTLSLGAVLLAVLQAYWIYAASPWSVGGLAIPAVAGALLGAWLGHTLTARDRLQHESGVDPLTGLLNRRALEKAGALELRRAARYGAPFGLLLLDIDHFKRVNDTHGHAAGDAVLRTVASLLGEVTRCTDMAGRLGGDEMVLLAPSTGMAGTRMLAEKVRLAVSRQAFPEAPKTPVRISIGVAVFVPGDTWESLLRRADEALYRAKRAGRNQAATMRCLRPALPPRAEAG